MKVYTIENEYSLRGYRVQIIYNINHKVYEMIIKEPQGEIVGHYNRESEDYDLRRWNIVAGAFIDGHWNAVNQVIHNAA